MTGSTQLRRAPAACLYEETLNPTPLLLPVQWDVPKVAGKSRDLQGKHVGSLGGGAIGSLVMERLKVTSGARRQRVLCTCTGTRVLSTPSSCI